MVPFKAGSAGFIWINPRFHITVATGPRPLALGVDVGDCNGSAAADD
jgi:hypothetical protein